MRLSAVVLGLVVASGGQARAQQAARNPVREAAIDTLLLRDATLVLAHDSLLGRDTGSPGAAAAARIIVDRLEALGLQPAAGDGSFTQSVPLYATSVAPASTLVLASDGDSTVFRAGTDFVLLAPDSADAGRFEGDIRFLGMGDHAAAAIDPADVDGRVLAILGGLDADSTLDGWTADGARALLLLVPDSAAFADVRRGPGAPVLSVPGVPARVGHPPLPVLIAGPVVTRNLLDGVTMPPRRSGEAFRAVPLPTTAAASWSLLRESVPGVNIVARIEGSDPELSEEVVAFTAHYDHIGIGPPDEEGDSIYNGFSDNAAGVAMLLAIADVMRRDPPDRSVLFLFLTGEERGLLGSSYMATRPPWPGGLDAVHALINLDAGAPPRPPASWRIAGGLAADGIPTALGALADSVALDNGWSTRLETARPNSDYWPFAGRGVPAIFIIPGNEWESTTTEERDSLRARWDRYHQPGDEYHTDFPFSGLRRYAGLALAIGYAAASH